MSKKKNLKMFNINEEAEAHYPKDYPKSSPILDLYKKIKVRIPSTFTGNRYMTTLVRVPA